MIIFALLVLLDQISKYLIRQGGGFYICNRGIAFSLRLPSILFWILWTIIIAIILLKVFNLKFRISNFDSKLNFEFKKLEIDSKFKIQNYGIILILSGALSNILDRLYFGCVIDFIKFPYWPFFNLADTFIVIGVIITVAKIRTTDSH